MYLSFLISVLLAFGSAIATSKEHSGFKQSSTSSSLSSEAVDHAMASSRHLADIMIPKSLASTLRSFGGNGPRFTASPTGIPIVVEVSAPPLDIQTSPGELGLSTSEQFKTRVLRIHSWYRARRGADPSVWNDALANSSTSWVGKCMWDIQDWKNTVGGLTLGELDEGALASTDLGLSTATNTGSTAHTTASTTAVITTTAAVSSIETKNKASTLCRSLFAMIIGLIIADSVTTCPSVVVSLLLNSDFAIAIPQDSVSSALASGVDGDIFSASFSMTSKPPLHINMQAAVQSSISPPSPTLTPASTSFLSPPPFSPITVFISGHNTSPSINTQARPEETGFSSPPEFKARMLWGINWYRQILNHSDLVWDDALAGSSANWTYLCDFWNKNIVSEHYGYTKARYPLEVDIPGVTYNYGITDVINLWVEAALMYYNETDGIYTGVRDTYNETDVFTQMVWKDTTLLGCGWNNCPAEYVVDNGHPWLFVVCEYYPKGNTGDATVWTYNVGPIKAHAYDQLKSGLPKPSGPGSKSAGSTTTTTLGQHLTTTAGVVSSQNSANRMEQTLYVVIITSVVMAGGLI